MRYSLRNLKQRLILMVGVGLVVEVEACAQHLLSGQEAPGASALGEPAGAPLVSMPMGSSR